MRNKIHNAERKALPIGVKVIIILSLFVVFVVGGLALFQLPLLSQFWTHTKNKELSKLAKNIAIDLQDEEVMEDETHNELQNRISEYAKNNANFIVIYEVEDDQVQTSIYSQNSIPMNEQILNEYVVRTKENDGDYSGVMSMLGGFDQIGKEDFPGAFRPKEERQGMLLFHSKLVDGCDGKTYFIFLQSTMEPVDTTVNVSRSQFIWIAIVFVLQAVLLAIILNKSITKPLSKMNMEAKKLANGNYDVSFNEKGYKEIKELSNTLNHAAEEMGKVSALEKELISNISHDLRTPLTMIRGYAEVMRDLPGENTPENLQTIIGETEHLSELVNDMLDLSKIQAGSRKAVPEEIEVTKLMSEVLERYEKFTKHNGFQISFEANCDVKIMADRNMFLQVLYNIINNAINYSGDKKVVRVVQTIHDNYVRISVIDSGIGIEKEQLPYIWDRYYRGDTNHKSAIIGTGLGLPIVKSILEQHHAIYGVDSTIGVGSTFWFEMPILH